MKTVSEKQALVKLRQLKTDFQNHIRENYEFKAKNCLTCETKGECCTDAHFVNVHITRLEAVAIQIELRKLPFEKQVEIEARIKNAIEKYDLKSSGDTFAQTFACPLFEKEIGCTIHFAGKPAPCMHHACYENKADLPPDELQTEIESEIEKLNKQTYKQLPKWLPLPVFLHFIKRD